MDCFLVFLVFRVGWASPVWTAARLETGLGSLLFLQVLICNQNRTSHEHGRVTPGHHTYQHGKAKIVDNAAAQEEQAQNDEKHCHGGQHRPAQGLVYRTVYHFAEFDLLVLVAILADPVVYDNGIV